MENLFTNQIEETQKTTENQDGSNFYKQVLENRTRPAIDQENIHQEVIEDVKKTELTVPKAETTENGRKIYSYDEAVADATVYFKGDNLAASVWVNKYALKDSQGNIYESNPDQMHWRIANEIYRVEQKYVNPMPLELIYSLLKEFKYIIPQGSPMAGIGNNFQIASLSNCFVIGNDSDSDSYGGIMKIDQEQVQLMKRRGGVGHDLSHIRPKGSPVKNSALTSTGIVPFMERYSNSTREVAQDGRRGALMLSISVKHPDSESFIDAKMESGKVTGANVSVKIHDDFMQSIINNTPYTQQYPIDSTAPKYQKQVNATDIWNKIVHNAWKSAEPGILFWDTITRESVPDCYSDLGFKTLSTNPCGEIPLCAYDSCRLLAINLYSYVDRPFTPEASFDFELFVEHVKYAHRIMDDIVDLELEKIDGILAKIKADPEDPEVKRVETRLWENIKKKSEQGRRIGIGITAEGDMLAALGVRYGSDTAIDFSVNVHQLLAIEAYRASVELAKERGAFPIYSAEKESKNPFINRLFESEPELKNEMQKFGRRNIAMLTIAPTGSVSICTQTTSGIEPVFLASYKRRRKVNPNDKNVTVSFVDEVGDAWEEYNVFHPKFLKWLKVTGYDVEAVKLYDEEQLKPIIEKSPYYKATSNDVDWVAKVKMQGAIQKWVDHSISVTVNVPNDANEDLIAKIYQTAWESGCKGITVYRDGSRSGVLVSGSEKKEESAGAQFKETNAPARPKRIDAEVVRFQNDYEKWIAVVGVIDGRPYEIFTGKAEDFYLPTWVTKGYILKHKEDNMPTRYDFQFEDKQGYKVTIEALSRSFNEEYWNYAKLISGILRHGMPLPQVVDLVSNLKLDNESINTWKNGIVRGLKKFIPDGTVAEGKKCPECGDKDGLVYKEGCLTCNSCGFSKCG